jgi:hypothetical protein
VTTSFAEVTMLQPDRTAELSALLEQRLLILDGAMGTMIQRHGLQEADYRGSALCRSSARPEGQQRPAGADPAGDHRRHPPRLS